MNKLVVDGRTWHVRYFEGAQELFRFKKELGHIGVSFPTDDTYIVRTVPDVIQGHIINVSTAT